MIIDKTDSFFDGVPASLEGEVLLSADDNGVITATQENFYIQSLATPAQKIKSGWHNHQAVFDAMDLQELNKPTKQEVIDQISKQVNNALGNDGLPYQARTAMQNAIENLTATTAALELDATIQHMLNILHGDI